MLSSLAAGADQKSGTSAAPQQPAAGPRTAADVPHTGATSPPPSATSPSASSASLRPGTAQLPGAFGTAPGSVGAASGHVGTGPGRGNAPQQQQQYGGSGMPLGAVDMSRAGGPAPALADDNGAANGLVRL